MRDPETSGQDPPAPAMAHRAVDGLLHEPRQTSLVYAICVASEVWHNPCAILRTSAVSEGVRQVKEWNVIDGLDQGPSRGVARRAPRLELYREHE
jgi:hypothetical protein